MHTNFVPKLNGRYLSSNVNITVFDKKGAKVSVPVGGEYEPLDSISGSLLSHPDLALA